MIRARAFAATCVLAAAVGACVANAPAPALGTSTSALGSTRETFEWVQVRPHPVRNNVSVAYDTRRGRIVTFGGVRSSTVFNETWEWDGAVWRERRSPTLPPARAGGVTAFDETRGVTMLFGGAGFFDAWAWDGVRWTELDPPADTGGWTSGACDTKRGRMVFVGSATTGRTTWEYDGSTWTRIAVASPKPGSSVYDAARDRVVHVDTDGETWEYDGAAWTQKAPATRPTFLGSLTWDAKRMRVARFDGGRSRCDWTGVDWTCSALTGGPATGIAFYDVRTTGSLLFELPVSSTTDVDGKVWRLDGTTWVALTSAARPPLAEFGYGSGITYDEGRKEVVALITDYTNFSVQTWIWSGTQWTRKVVTSPPIGTFGFSYDSHRARAVAFDSIGATPPTWEWTGTTWAQTTTPNGPRTNEIISMMAYDKGRRKTVILMFDGTLWQYDGVDWASSRPATRPPDRAEGAFVYDEARDRIVLFGGIGAGNRELDDTWEWDGATWSQKSPRAKPPARSVPGAAYDRGRKRVVIFGGGTAVETTVLDDAWDWDGTEWSPMGAGEGPSPRKRPLLAFDGASGRMIVHGGGPGGNGFPYADAWILARRGGACTADADCGATGFCTDGVCCETQRCGTCEACNLTDPGRCTPVAGEGDPDTCTGTKSCDENSVCKLALGAAAARDEDCASGIIADGVCCDTRCNTSCQACRADLKQSNDRSGVCDHARTGTDPRSSCEPDAANPCGRDGMCDGRGQCKLESAGAACGPISCIDDRAAGKVCDGLGACADAPRGIACGAYRCDAAEGCLARCASDAECTEAFRCEGGTCVTREGASCDGDHTVKRTDGTTLIDCGAYKCEGATCKSACARSSDCVFPGECSFEGACVPPLVRVEEAGGVQEKSGCAMSPRDTRSSHALGALLLASAALARKRRTRR